MTDVPRVLVDYYQPAFMQYDAELTASGFAIESPSSKRRTFWGVVRPGTYVGAQAHELLDMYLRSIEIELATTIAGHSLAYWVHAYRRLSPGPIGTDKRPLTTFLMRGTLEAAIQKHATFEPCSGLGLSTEVPDAVILNGQLTKPEFRPSLNAVRKHPQLVLTNFGGIQYRELYELEKLAFEVWRSFAQRRVVGKGGSLIVSDHPELVGLDGPDELFELTRRFDARLDQSPVASRTGAVYLSRERSNKLTSLLLPRYNVLRIREPFHDVVMQLHKCTIAHEFVPNFLWIPFDFSAYWNSHQPFADSFLQAHGVELESVVLVVCALAWHAQLAWKDQVERVWRCWQRAYDGPIHEDKVTTVVRTMSELAAETIGLRAVPSSDSIEGALRFLDLRSKDRSALDYANSSSNAMLLPYAGEYRLVDYAWIFELFDTLCCGLAMDDQNFKGKALESLVRERASVLSTAELRALDGTARQVDAAFGVGENLLIVECRAKGKSLGYSRGDIKATEWRLEKVVLPALNDVDAKVRWLAQHPCGTNYDISGFRRILGVAVTPFVEYVASLDSFFWLSDSVPRVLTPKELDVALDSAWLIGAFESSVSAVEVGVQE